ARPRPAERGLQPSSKPPRPRPAASNPLEALPQNIESVPSIKANRHVHRVQKMTTSMRDRAIANFPLLDSFTESHCNRSTDLYNETSPSDCVAKHCFTESHATPAEKCRGPHPRIPHRVGGRAADRRVQRQSPIPSRPDDDLACLQTRPAGQRIVRPAMDT